MDRRPGVHEGPDHDREARRRHRQLPRRVRDDPVAGRPARWPSRASRSTSPTAGGPPTRARSARSTRPSSSTSRAAASRPTRRASSSCSASWSRSSPGSRWPTPRTACASCSRRSGPAAPAARPSRRQAASTACGDRPAAPLDEVPPGTMKMAWVDGTSRSWWSTSDGEYRASQGICSHEYFELDRGFLTGGTMTCALHLSRFDLDTGEPLDPPAELPLALYDGDRRGRPGPDRGPGRTAARQRVRPPGDGSPACTMSVLSPGRRC